jgi:sugar/nucleoside kinase (ribokinase family)
MKRPFPFTLRTAARFDVVGFGFNTHDHVCVTARPPRVDGKQRLRGYAQMPGGQVPTALVALQRWGLRTAYVGPFGDDRGGTAQRAALAGEGIDLNACRTRTGVASQTSIILVDDVSGERSVLWTRPTSWPCAPASSTATRWRPGAPCCSTPPTSTPRSWPRPGPAPPARW